MPKSDKAAYDFEGDIHRGANHLVKALANPPYSSLGRGAKAVQIAALCNQLSEASVLDTGQADRCAKTLLSLG